jgi:hypothetical protein
MRCSLAAVIVVWIAFVAHFVGAAELTFQEVKVGFGRFSVEMPAKPKPRSNKIDDEITEFEYPCVMADGRVFMVKYVDFPAKYVDDRTPDDFIQTYRKGSRKGKELTEDKEITVDGAPGRDYRLEAEPGFFVREQTILSGRRLYTLFVGSADRTFLDSPDANRFFKSFQIMAGRPKP